MISIEGILLMERSMATCRRAFWNPFPLCFDIKLKPFFLETSKSSRRPRVGKRKILMATSSLCPCSVEDEDGKN